MYIVRVKKLTIEEITASTGLVPERVTTKKAQDGTFRVVADFNEAPRIHTVRQVGPPVGPSAGKGALGPPYNRREIQSLSI